MGAYTIRDWIMAGTDRLPANPLKSLRKFFRLTAFSGWSRVRPVATIWPDREA